MRKIKELEERIGRLESLRNCDNEVCEKLENYRKESK